MKTVLILHGWGSSSQRWQRIKESLENKGIKVFVPDLPGFGESQCPDRPWSTDDYVSWAKSFIEKNIDGHFFLLGHSFGGKVALKISLQMPEKVLGLILAAPPIFRWTPDWKAKLLGFTWKKIDPALKPLMRFEFFRKIFDFFRWLFYRYVLKKTQYLKFNEAMKKTFEIVNKEDFSALLPEVKTKTLIIWGEKDNLVPVKYAHLIKEKVSNSELVIFPGIKHSPYRDVPEEFTKAILNFIQNK